MDRTLAIAATALVAAGALSGTALALTSGDTTARTIATKRARVAAFSGPQTVSARVRLSFPRSWTRVSSPLSRLSLRTGTAGCGYTITARTGVAVSSAADANSVAFSRALAPAAGPLVLEEGTRGIAAWRVTRVTRSAPRVVLRAVGVAPRNSVSRQLALTGGARAFQVTTIDARSRTSDHCASGSYRKLIGPSIGDALATARGRAFADLAPKH